MLGAVQYDKIESTPRIVNVEVTGLSGRRRLDKQLDAVIEFVKLYYVGHVGLDADPLHDTDLSLLGHNASEN